MPCSPSSPICGHSSIGKRSAWSISAASGAILSVGEALRRVADRLRHLAKVEIEAGHVAHDVSPVDAALAEPEAFEQGARQAYVQLQQHRHRGDIPTHGHRPDRHPVDRAHADGLDAGQPGRRLARPTSAPPRSRRRSSAPASSGDDIDRIYMGCVLPAGLGQAPARQAAIKAGLPTSVQATTVNKVCGSGMQTVIMGAEALAAGNADLIVAGGMEFDDQRALPAQEAPRRRAHRPRHRLRPYVPRRARGRL